MDFLKWKKWARESLKLKYHWILLIVLVVPAALYVCFGILSGSSFSTFSFSENLLAEAYGLAATILIIERLLRHQKQQEWMPVSSFARSRIQAQIEYCFDYLTMPWITIRHEPLDFVDGEPIFMYGGPHDLWEADINALKKNDASLNTNPDQLETVKGYFFEIENKIAEMYMKYQYALSDSPKSISQLQGLESEWNIYRMRLAQLISYLRHHDGSDRDSLEKRVEEFKKHTLELYDVLLGAYLHFTLSE